MAFVGLGAWAQTDSLKNAYTRIEALEQLCDKQANQLNQLFAKIEEVTAQNLALKKDLDIRKPKAIAKDGDYEYRVSKIIGNKDTRDVNIVMYLYNNGDLKEENTFHPMQMIDELGNGYDSQDIDRISASIDGLSNHLIYDRIESHPNAPLTIKVKMKGWKKDSNYIKNWNFMVYNPDSGNKHNIEFKDLEITWIEE